MGRTQHLNFHGPFLLALEAGQLLGDDAIHVFGGEGGRAGAGRRDLGVADPLRSSRRSSASSGKASPNLVSLRSKERCSDAVRGTAFNCSTC